MVCLWQVIRGSLNYAAECLRRGKGWTKFNSFTKRLEYKYITVTERETLKTTWEDQLGVHSPLDRFSVQSTGVVRAQPESGSVQCSVDWTGAVGCSVLSLKVISCPIGDRSPFVFAP